MKGSRFINYLLYRDCEEIEQHETYYIFRNPRNNAVCVVPKAVWIHEEHIDIVCRELELNVPDIS